jgi:hypothetical protein
MKKIFNVVAVGFGSDGEYFENKLFETEDDKQALELKLSIENGKFQKILIEEKQNETIPEYNTKRNCKCGCLCV